MYPFSLFVCLCVQQQRENRPCQQQVQKIASESMIPTYRSGTDSMHKSNQSGTNSKQQQQQQQQQNNSSSFSANAPKADSKNAVNNESNQNKNQCSSPVKRRSISQIDVRHFLIVYSYSIILYFVLCCCFKIQNLFTNDNQNCVVFILFNLDVCCLIKKKTILITSCHHQRSGSINVTEIIFFPLLKSILRLILIAFMLFFLVFHICWGGYRRKQHMEDFVY